MMDAKKDKCCDGSGLAVNENCCGFPMTAPEQMPKPETREVCTACGQVDGYHLQKCRISELQAEVERLTQLCAKHFERGAAENHRAESAERKLAEAVAALNRISDMSVRPRCTMCDTLTGTAAIKVCADNAIDEAAK
jgi:hypothetical protein